MFHKPQNEAIIGLSKPIYASMLNGNNFLTLDQLDTHLPAKKQTYVFDKSFNMTAYRELDQKRDKYKAYKNQIHSAQYSRQYPQITSHRFRASMHVQNSPKNKHKNLLWNQQAIQSDERIVFPQNLQSKLVRNSQILKKGGMKLKKRAMENKKHIKALSFTVQTQKKYTLQLNGQLFLQNIEQKWHKKSPQTHKNIAEHYKNRKKIAERNSNHHKKNENIFKNTSKSPAVQKSQNSPKIIKNLPQISLDAKNKSEFLSSIEGSKIRYSQGVHQQDNLKKYKKKVTLLQHQLNQSSVLKNKKIVI